MKMEIKKINNTAKKDSIRFHVSFEDVSLTFDNRDFNELQTRVRFAQAKKEDGMLNSFGGNIKIHPLENGCALIPNKIYNKTIVSIELTDAGLDQMFKTFKKIQRTLKLK